MSASSALSLRFVTDSLVVRTTEEATPELIAAVRRLLPQLSSSCSLPSASEIAEIAASSATRLLAAELDGELAGITVLVLFRLPTGLRAWIEDVVVDSAFRSRGVGEALLREALRQAAAAGARTVDLTSRSEREAAIRLYERVGFERRDTNVFRCRLDRK